MITVFLADDHVVLRQGLRQVMESEPDLKVVGEASTGLEVPDQVDRLRPDVLLLDLGMPELHGLEVTRHVTHRTPSTRVLILSMHSSDEYVIGAFRHGAAGYVLKGSDAAEVIGAIRRVASGARYVSPSLSDQIVDALLHKPSAEVADPYDALTDREREVFQLMAEGCSNTEIGEKLFISSRTVETHRANVMRKLALRTQTDVVRCAIRRGILPRDG